MKSVLGVLGVLSVLSVLWPGVPPVLGAAPRSIADLLPLGRQPVEPEGPSGGGATRIVGGKPESIRRAPFVVSLVNHEPGTDYDDICGGSIITKTCVLTAAHCSTKIRNGTMKVRAGSSYLYSGGTEHGTTAVHIHPKYNDKTVDYDVAVLMVHPPFDFSNPKIQSIELAHEEPRTGQMVTNYGWGSLESGGDISYHLRAVTVPVNDRQECIRKYQRLGFTDPITPRMFCQGSPGKDHCEGDSGGPAVTQEGDQVGIVSWAVGCATARAPGVMGNVPNYEMYNFIHDHCLSGDGTMPVPPRPRAP